MNKHPELIKGKFTSSFTLKEAIKLWEIITENLNAVNGAKKDWKSWRKCWHDLRSSNKGKYAIIKQSMAATGGDEKSTEILTQQEEQVLDLMCSTSFDGHPEIIESTVNLLEDSNDVDLLGVEYLDEDEENVIPKVINIDLTKKDCNISTSRKRKTIINNEYNYQKLSNNKQNINKIIKNDTNIEQPSTSKLNEKSIENIEILVNNTGNKQNERPFGTKTVATKETRSTLEISTKLNDIYEKTYELKKSYYEARLQYLKRSVEAKEKIANIISKCGSSNI